MADEARRFEVFSAYLRILKMAAPAGAALARRSGWRIVRVRSKQPAMRVAHGHRLCVAHTIQPPRCYCIGGMSPICFAVSGENPAATNAAWNTEIM